MAAPTLRFVKDPNATPKEKLKAARALVNDGRVNEAVSFLESAANQNTRQQIHAMTNLMRHGQVVRSIKAIVCLLKAAKYRAETLKLLEVFRELVNYEKQPDPAKPEEIDYKIKDAGSPVTIIAFTGLDKRFTVAVYFLERLLGRFGVNLITVYDPHEAFYLAGIPSLGVTVEDTCAGLKRLCDGLGTKDIICIGQSSGGYGALRYGVELNASHVLAFSPSFIGVLDKDARLDIARRTGHLFKEDAVDLRKLYAKRDKAPPVTVVYGAENRYDERSATMLGSMRNATVRPLPGVSRHGTLSESVCQGVFFDLVSGAFADVGSR